MRPYPSLLKNKQKTPDKSLVEVLTLEELHTGGRKKNKYVISNSLHLPQKITEH